MSSIYQAQAVMEYLDDVLREVSRQEGLWGVQIHPDGTGSAEQKRQASNARKRCQAAFDRGEGTYADILKEEFWEALAAEPNSAELIEELVQVAAVCVSWIRAINYRHAE